MKEAVNKILNVYPEEANRAYLLLAMGFFMGLFIATYKVSAETLFLDAFKVEREQAIPLGFISQGAFGLLSTFIFSYYQNRVKFKWLALATLAFITMIAVSIYLGHVFDQGKRFTEFIAYITVVPFIALLLLIFWGVFGRIYNLRQSKRIIGSIDSGQLIASVIALFSIPLLLKVIDSVTTLVLVGSFSILCCTGVLWIIVNRYNMAREEETRDERKKKIFSFKRLFTNRYTRYLCVFVVVSMVGVEFLDYSFLNVTQQQFPEQKNLATYLSNFQGTIVVFSILFQTFITDRIITQYGLKVALLINPVLLGIFTIIAIIVGLIFGYDVSTADNFIVFFIIISMSKLFIDSLKDSLDGPAFKLYYLPIHDDFRLDVQSKIDGFVTVFSGVISGGVILFLSNLKAFNMLHATIAVVPLVVVWYFVTNKMHHRYKDTLQETLEENKKRKDTAYRKIHSLRSVFENQLRSHDINRILFTLNLIKKIDPALFEDKLRAFKTIRNEKLQSYIQENIQYLEIELDRDRVSRTSNSKEVTEIRQLAIDAYLNSENTNVIALKPKKLYQLAKSRDVDDRVFVAKLLRKIINDDNVWLLLELMRDINAGVRLTAINSSRIVQRPECSTLLIEHLASHLYCHAAASALTNMGDDILPVLEAAFHKSGQKQVVMLRIVQVLGNIGTKKSHQLLWEKIEFPDKEIVSRILYAFRKNDYKVSENQAGKIKTIIEMEAGNVMWNYASLLEIDTSNEIGKLIEQAIYEELASNYDRIYLLLSLIYDGHSVQLVRDNIESKTNEGVAFAIELMDIFLDPNLKTILFPVFDDLSIGERVRQLHDHYPRGKYSKVDILLHIINRNYNQINRWTKACAIYALGNHSATTISNTMIAQLFNIDPLLREIAAWFIYNKNRKAYFQITKRLDYDTNRELNDILFHNEFSIDREYDETKLRFNRTLYLKQVPVFQSLPYLVLSEIVELIQTRTYAHGGCVIEKGTFADDYIFIVVTGVVSLYDGEACVLKANDNYIWGELTVLGIDAENFSAYADAETKLYCLYKSHYYELLAKYDNLAREYLENLTFEQQPKIIEEENEEVPDQLDEV